MEATIATRTASATTRQAPFVVAEKSPDALGISPFRYLRRLRHLRGQHRRTCRFLFPLNGRLRAGAVAEVYGVRNVHVGAGNGDVLGAARRHWSGARGAYSTHLGERRQLPHQQVCGVW